MPGHAARRSLQNRRKINMSFVEHSKPIPLIKPTNSPQVFTRFNESKIAYRSQNDFYLMKDQCTHRGISLKGSTVCPSDGTLVCPYHGKKNHPTLKLVHKYDFLWTQDPASYFSKASDYTFCGSRSFELEAPYHFVLDNFNEGSHTPYVHKVLGPSPAETADVTFEWKDFGDRVFFQYLGPQRKNFLFYGLNFNRQIDWHISWDAFSESSHMAYHSRWLDRKSGKPVLSENLNYYFIHPIDKNRTALTAFVFTKPRPWMKIFLPLVKKISMFLTKNQVQEDVVFYKIIGVTPRSLNGFDLDKYDEPLVALRKNLHPLFQKYLE